MSALSLFLSELFEENGTERVNIKVDNVMSALSLFLSQLFEENGTERVNIQVDNVKKTHSSFQRRTSSLEAVLSRSDHSRDRWSGIAKIIPRQQKSRNTERAGSVDSLLALPRRKQSRSIYSTIQLNVKGGTTRKEAAEILFFDNYRLDTKETKTTKTTKMAISAD
jgi:hypothetical protein